MKIAVRFAPSPTGFLHIGNVRTAIVNWLFAARHGGSFMFRLDDTDEERSTQEYADAIAQDLTWLGLKWDRYARESDRVVEVLENVAAGKELRRILRDFEPIRVMVYQNRGKKVRALFDQQDLPRREQAIRTLIKKEGLWLR